MTQPDRLPARSAWGSLVVCALSLLVATPASAGTLLGTANPFVVLGASTVTNTGATTLTLSNRCVSFDGGGGTVPEPTSLALVAAALTALPWMRRRRGRSA